MQWDKILADAERAQALPRDAMAAFLSTLETTTDHAEEVRSLLTRLSKGFLATSADDSSDSFTLVGAAGIRVGPWRLEALLGRGGMGEVWGAKRDDGLYEQNAAVKLMQPGGAERAARFDNERRRLAQMEHAGIARILDGGITADGIAYMAMDLVDGEPIDLYAAKTSPRVRLQLIADACDAVHHAHTKLILHRDLKPANILVDKQGQVRLIDFGIASSLEDDEEGGPLTLAYAAPEQLRGAPLSVPTDIFALGVVLSQLMTGEIPRRTEEAALSEASLSRLPKDIQAIVLKASRAKPEERYPSAAIMAADIRAYLARRPVGARGEGASYRFTKFLSRYPLASAMSALATIALVAGLVFSLKFAQEAEAEAARAREALADSEYQFELAQSHLQGQNTYGIMLYDLFAEEGRTNELTTRLIDRWETLHTQSDQSPEQSASSSYVIGRQFFLRRDHTNAQKILGAWIDKGYGPESLLASGRELYAMSLFESGRRAEALPQFQKVMDSYNEGHRKPLSDQLSLALRFATLTNETVDIDRAERLYHAREAERSGEELTPAQRLASLPALLHIKRLRKDMAGAISVAEDIVSVYEDNPDYFFGRGLARINLSELKLYEQDDAIAAEKYARAVLELDRQAEGESAVTARAFFVLGRSLMHQRKLHEARAAFAEGRQLQEKYTGRPRGGPEYDLAEAELTALLGESGAEAFIDQAAAAGATKRDLALSAALVALNAGRPGDEVAAEFLDAIKPSDDLSYLQGFLYRRLIDLGLPEN